MSVVNIEAVLVSAKELLQLEAVYSESQTALTAANTQIETLTSDALKAQEKIRVLNEQVINLKKQLADAIKPPVVVPPPPTKTLAPLISKTEISNLRALTIENGDDEPDTDQYTLMRNVLTKAHGMKFNAARWFMNALEIANHAKLRDTDINHLPGFARSLGIAYIADTVDSEVWRTFKIEDDPRKTATEKAKAIASLKVYLEGLVTLGAKAFVVNDANTYRDGKNKDGTPLFPAKTLERIVGRIRSITPTIPIIASLTGNAVIASYKIMPGDAKEVAAGKFDFVEAQTFGKVEELKGFFDNGFDVYCLDARTGMSEVDITTRGAVILAAKPKAAFYYADLAKDWLNMTLGKQAAIRKVIEGLAAGA